MKNTLHRPNLQIRDRYYTEVVPELRRFVTEVTGDSNRDDSSIGDDKDKKIPRSELERLGYSWHGAVIMKATTSPIDIARTDGEPILKQNEVYTGIHLRPLDVEEATREYVVSSLRNAAEYLAEPANRSGDILAGITYARLGRTAANAFGFERAELPIMPDPEEQPDIQPFLVYMPIDDFVERYGISD